MTLAYRLSAKHNAVLIIWYKHQQCNGKSQEITLVIEYYNIAETIRTRSR